MFTWYSMVDRAPLAANLSGDLDLYCLKLLIFSSRSKSACYTFLSDLFLYDLTTYILMACIMTSRALS